MSVYISIYSITGSLCFHFAIIISTASSRTLTLVRKCAFCELFLCPFTLKDQSMRPQADSCLCPVRMWSGRSSVRVLSPTPIFLALIRYPSGLLVNALACQARGQGSVPILVGRVQSQYWQCCLQAAPCLLEWVTNTFQFTTYVGKMRMATAPHSVVVCFFGPHAPLALPARRFANCV